MGQVQHGSATTTAAVRRAIQHSQESLRGLAKRYGINPKTAAKWRKRTSLSDRRTGPRDPRSTVLSAEDRSEEHTSELQSRQYLVCRLLLEKKNKQTTTHIDNS